MISIKSELGIFADSKGELLTGYDAHVENDELIITFNNGEDIFEYHPPKSEVGTSPALIRRGTEGVVQRVQETLFNEKQTIIENSLFGVDINPNSVKIARLRLWIELLKNAFYTKESNYSELETLPNIDINIKEGNSLISRFSLDADLKSALKTIRYTIDDYKNFVRDYKNTNNKDEKANFRRFIEDIKSNFRTEIGKNDPRQKKLSNLAYELHNKFQTERLIDVELSKKDKEKLIKEETKIEAEIKKISEELEAEKKSVIYKNAFEWRFEFPEVLDDEGKFVGFDVVIGNPPYGVEISKNEKSLFQKAYQTIDDVYTMFLEKGFRIINTRGIISLITPVFWLNGDNYFNTRNLLLAEGHLEIGITLPYNVFQDAYVDTGIYIFSKSQQKSYSMVYEFEPKYNIDVIRHDTIPFVMLNNHDWQGTEELKIIFNQPSRSILERINSQKIKLGEITVSVRGILADTKDYHSKKLNKSYQPVLIGKIDRYYYDDTAIEFVKYGDNLKEKPNSLDCFEGERILVRRIISRKFRIMATIVEQKFVNKKDVYIFKPNQNNFSCKYLLALINSKLISYIKTSTSNSAKKDDFTQLTLNDLRSIGIPKHTTKINLHLESTVDKILSAKKINPNPDTNALESEIDKIVYQLYGLTEEEIKIVEGN